MKTRLERVLKEARRLSDTNKQDVRFSVNQRDDAVMDTEDDECPPRMRRPGRNELHSPIGEACMLKRIADSEKQEFKIDREITTARVRYVPTGPPSFYRDPASFYNSPTDLCCLWCTEAIPGRPIGMPTRFRENRRDRDDFYFVVTGQFCSPSCMLAEARARGGSLALARLFLKRVHGIGMKLDIAPAPPRTCLRKFGGEMDIDAFRATGATGIITEEIRAPLYPAMAGTTEIEKSVIVVSEVGGKQLARRAMVDRSTMHMHVPSAVPRAPRGLRQTGKPAPTIQEQIALSACKTDRQMTRLGAKKTKTITSFYKVKKSTI